MASPPSGVGSFVFSALAFLVAVATGYVCGLWAMAYMASILPLMAGGAIIFTLWLGAITTGAVTIAESGKRVVGIIALIVSFAWVGGCYGGCKKGLHDSECQSGASTPKCRSFW